MIGYNYAVVSDWIFQIVFLATAASIVSGTLAERIKVWPFLLFVVDHPLKPFQALKFHCGMARSCRAAGDGL